MASLLATVPCPALGGWLYSHLTVPGRPCPHTNFLGTGTFQPSTWAYSVHESQMEPARSRSGSSVRGTSIQSPPLCRPLNITLPLPSRSFHLLRFSLGHTG